ncbi:MAG: SH3 domain-containing protein [Cyanobium sp. ELA712]
MEVPSSPISHRKVRTLMASLASLVFCITLLFNVSAASAATLADDMVQASKDACISLAKKRGFAVETVIDAQPADGDSAHIVLKLAKGGDRYEFNCGFSQNIRQFVEATPVATTKQSTPTASNQPSNRVVDTNRDRNAVVQRDRTAVVQRDTKRQRDQVVVAEPKRDSGFNPAWLLPLLLLPLAFLFLRNREADAESGEPTKVGVYTTPTKPAAVKVDTTATTATTANKVVEALIRVQDSAIEVRSGAGLTNSVARTIAAGSKVRLSGRYQDDWAELAEGGWIAIQSLASDPRQS